jgi:hypothetical protein
MKAFTAIRHFASSQKDLFEQVNDLRKELPTRVGEHDVLLTAIYNALENLLDKRKKKISKNISG